MSGRETSGLLAVREAKCFPDRWRFRKVVGTKVSERAHTWLRSLVAMRPIQYLSDFSR